MTPDKSGSVYDDCISLRTNVRALGDGLEILGGTSQKQVLACQKTIC